MVDLWHNVATSIRRGQRQPRRAPRYGSGVTIIVGGRTPVKAKSRKKLSDTAIVKKAAKREARRFASASYGFLGRRKYRSGII